MTTRASLTTAPACSATYTHTASSGPGSYSTSCSGGVSADYSFTYVNGTFRVGKAPLVVTASSPADGVYGDGVPTITASYQTFVYGQSASDLTTAPSCSTTYAHQASSGPGSYTTSCSGGTSDNYAFTYKDGSFKVGKAPLTVTASSPPDGVVGDPVPTITGSYAGFVYSQGPSDLSTKPTCSTTYTVGSPAGTYPTNCSGGSSGNYAFIYHAGSFKVGLKPATLGYTGSLFWSTGSTTETSTNVTFRGLLTPAWGGTVDLSKATVDFLIYKSTNLTQTSSDAKCLGAAVSPTGLASCIVNGLGVDNWTVIMQLEPNSYFSAPNSDPVVLTVYQPATDKFATAGGWVTDPYQTVSAQNHHGNFGLMVRYKSGTTPSGQAVFVFCGTDGYDYVIKSNSWTGGGLSFGANTASFSGKANVTAFDPKTGLAVSGVGGGNYTHRVDVTDNGSTGDTYAISVYTPAGTLFHQAGTTGGQLPLGGGNVVVHTT